MPVLKKTFNFLFISILIWLAPAVQASPLGKIPTIQETNLKIDLENRSDLWTSPYRDKPISFRIYDLNLRAPIELGSGWVGSLNAELEGLSLGQSDIHVGTSAVEIGSDFRNQSLGIAMTRDLENSSSFTFYGAYASASDEPFKAARDTWAELTAIYRSPLQDNHHWVFLLNQSKNRGFANGRLFPYFGIAYSLNPELDVSFGFPFLKISSRPEGKWQKLLTLTPVSIEGEIQKKMSSQFEVDVKMALTVRSYLHQNRVADEDRIYYQEKYVETGFKTHLSASTDLTLNFGYAFDRKFYESSSIYRPSGQVLGLNSDIYGRLGMGFKL